MADVDWSNPCARAGALSAAYYQLVTGGQEQRVRFRNGDVEEDVTFTSTNAELLRQEMLTAQAACDEITTGRPSRRAVRAG